MKTETHSAGAVTGDNGAFGLQYNTWTKSPEVITGDSRGVCGTMRHDTRAYFARLVSCGDSII